MNIGVLLIALWLVALGMILGYVWFVIRADWRWEGFASEVYKSRVEGFSAGWDKGWDSGMEYGYNKAVRDVKHAEDEAWLEVKL